MDHEGDAEDPYRAALREGGLTLLAKTIAADVDAWLAQTGLPASWDGGVSYHTWLDYFDYPAKGAAALVICTEGLAISEELDGVSEWEDFLDSNSFWYEMHDPTIMVLYPEEGVLERLVHEALAFEWHARLVAPDFSSIYTGIFSYFAQNSERMQDLHWRAWEEFLASVFIAQGYRTKLGPGRGDRGVDVRLTESTIYGDQVTIVQAKRRKDKIDLELVAALSGVMHDQEANRGLYVTTSQFIPSAKAFAARQKRPIALATSSDVALWCDAISSKKPAPANLGIAILSSDIEPRKIVCAELGYEITYHEFAYIVAESPSAVRLAKLHAIELPERRNSSGLGGSGWQGQAIPDLKRGLSPETPTFTARRKSSPFGEPQAFWGDNGHFYTIWDGHPRWYNHLD